MIETVFTLEDEPMTPETPGTDAPEEGGMEEGGDSMPAALLGDEEGGSMETEGLLGDGEGEESGDEE